MKISIVSDLHCPGGELPKSFDVGSLEPADVLVVAGDLGTRDNWHEIRRVLEEAVGGKFGRIVAVKGNHDYYTAMHYFNDLEMPCKRDNFVESVQDGDRTVTFICSPMWTPIQHNELIRRALNDYNYIPGFDTYVCTYLFWENLKWIEDEVGACKARGEIPVVVTHHAPRIEMLDPKYADSEVNEAFYVMGEKAHGDIAAIDVPLWIHGHCHDFMDMRLGNTRYVRNPYGYESISYKETTGYRHNFIVEL
jgi:Icc-related predicted phosphoesterase